MSEEPRWKWNEKLRRYQNLKTGRMVSSAQITAWTDRVLAASQGKARTLFAMLRDGSMDVGAWEGRMRNLIRTNYVQEFLAGRGGLGKFTKSESGILGNMIKDQYKYLSGFAKEIAEGKLSGGQILTRMQMYMDAAREARERASMIAAKEAGFDEVFWKVDPEAENCEDCLAFQAMGWQKMEDDPYDGATPASGQTRCLVRCRCFLSYRKSGENVEQVI